MSYLDMTEFSEERVRTTLADLPLGGLHFYPKIGSTNDQALSWTDEVASDMSVFVTEEQTSGRGRDGRKWFSQPGSSLTFSVILNPLKTEAERIGLFSGLGALAVSHAIDPLLRSGSFSQIKWPNDVVIDRKKICGILVENHWIGDQFEKLVIGIGVNVTPQSIPRDKDLLIPATCLESYSIRKIDRCELLHSILKEMISWRKRIGRSDFIQAWESRLAFRNELVQVWRDPQPPIQGIIQGLDPSGGLILKRTDGQMITLHNGEVHLRPSQA